MNRCAHGFALWCSDCLAFVPARAALVVGLLVGLSCCVPVFPPGPGGEDCEALCANLDRLGCDWRPKGEGECMAWCLHFEGLGIDAANDCAASAASCEAVDACPGDGP
jgi:hypothetical protein